MTGSVKHSDFTIRDVTDADAQGIADVFDYFVENSFAAYPTVAPGVDFYHRMREYAGGYPFYAVVNGGDRVTGFGLLYPYPGADSFMHACEVAYFLMPETTGRGLGSRIPNLLSTEAHQMGVTTLLASVSSLNDPSIRFYQKHGFKQCGRFERIGLKMGREFDVVWFQKWL